jgi:hypothetical protein
MQCHNCLDGGNFLGMVCTRCGISARNNALLRSPHNNGRPVMPISPKIQRFNGKYSFLSNFYPAPVMLDYVWYSTVEHAYQAAKSLLVPERNNIKLCRTPGEAKKIGRQVSLRSDWEQVKENVMLDLLRQKFTPMDLRELLINTGSSVLVEGNSWGDTYWGQCSGVGQNKLGVLLMQVRSEIGGR